MIDKKLNIGIIGCGYWGPNLVRNFSSLANCRVSYLSDSKPGRLGFIKTEFPDIKTTTNYEEILSIPEIDAVCIATPVKTHKKIAIEALRSGKHVFVEKPMSSNLKDAEEMHDMSKKLGLKLAVGHVFQFAPAVRAIKKLIDDGAIGKVLHITSTRINLGPPQTEIDVIWDLGPHDFSILIHLINEYPDEVSSTNSYFEYGFSANDPLKLINNSDIQLRFPSGTSAHIHLSWLSSNKTRFMQIFGSEGTIVYDEMLALDGKVKLFGKGYDNRIGAKETDTKNLKYLAGEIHVIPLEQHEPLRMECEHFIDSVLNNTTLINDSAIGKDVVALIERASFKSL